MKKILFALLGVLIFTPNAFAVSNEENIDYATVDAPYVNLQAVDLGNGSVRLTWQTEFFEDMNEFLYWRLVRSNTNPKPIYPEDGSIFYDTNVTADSYIDVNANDGLNYYRVCGITSTMTRYCSNITAIDIDKDNTGTNGYLAVVEDLNLRLKLAHENTGNQLTWMANKYSKFVYWELVRSKDNPNPSYPEDGYIFYSNYADTNEYLDESPISVPVYYRLCAITSTRARYCSNVVTYDPNNPAGTEKADNSEEKVCTTDYTPVCGTDGETYSNACNAENKKIEIDYIGECSENIFTDITDSQYKKAIESIERAGLVGGYSDKTYRPTNTINRAEFTKILMLAVYSEEDAMDCNKDIFGFTDTDKTQWYAPYVCLAKRENILSGYADGSFQPSAEINTVEAFKITLLAYGVTLPEVSGEWYAPYWSYALENKILPTTITSVNQKINRGEMAQIIYNLENGTK